MALDPEVRELATGANFGMLTTLFDDGQPQTQPIWVDADDEHVTVNTEVHRQKFTNIEGDPRVTLTIWDADDAYRYAEVRGRVVDTVRGDEARRHIDELSQRYVGKDYPNPITSERVIVKIAPDRVNAAL